MNAGYLLKSQSTLAAWYKRDPGLLERHHSVRAFELVVCSRARLLQGLPHAERLAVSAAVKEVIMATDMRFHAAYCEKIHSRIRRAAGDRRALPAAEDMLLEIQLLLKCADISNAFKPFEVAKEWAVRVTEELFAQGDLERAGGLEVTPMCDRRAQSRVALQRGFVDGVVAPFLRGMAELHPGLRPHLAQLEENRRRWDGYTDEALVREVAEVGGRRRQQNCDPPTHSKCKSGVPVGGSKSPFSKGPRRPHPLSLMQSDPGSASPVATNRQETPVEGRVFIAVDAGRQISPLAKTPTKSRQSSPIAKSSQLSPLRGLHLHGRGDFAHAPRP